jgi:hypothetical protein
MHRPSPALIVALLALFVALGGAAAAGGIPFIAIRSVAGGGLAGTYQNPTIAANAVGSNQVIDGSLQSRDIAVAQGAIGLGGAGFTLQPGECNGPGRGIAGLQATDFVIANATPSVGSIVTGYVDTSGEPFPIATINVCNFSPNAITVPGDVAFHFIVIRDTA